MRLAKAEEVVNNGEAVMAEQKRLLAGKDQVISTKDKILQTTIYQNQKEVEIKDIKINELLSTIDINKKITKNEKRKSFWNGVKTGAGGTIILAAVGILLLSK